MSKSRSHPTPRGAKPPAPVARLPALLLGGLVAVAVGRALLASEAVAWLGDGQPFNMLVLSLSVLAALAAVGSGGFKARWTPTDVAVLLLWLCYSASAVRAAIYASPRPALNMLWEWTALAAVYFLVRQLARTGLQQRAVVGAMIALAVVLSAYGYWQYFVSMPADRAAYARDPEALLRQSDMQYTPGSVERKQFESRLQSNEPMATFALANSLAGYLLAWLLMAVGIAAAMWAARGANADPAARGPTADPAAPPGRALPVFALALISIAGCLVLTKSRSAWIGTAVGLAALPIALPAIRPRVARRLAWTAGIVIALLVGGAVAVGGFDREVFTQAGKSLGYRLEYWQATLTMIRERPWFGCGPGNFQDAYMQYKLPQASEEIQDPHNFLLEVWGTAGTPALVALVAVLVCFCRQTCRRAESGTESDSDARDSGTPALITLAGGIVGLALAYFVGPLVELTLDGGLAWAGAALGALVIWGIWPWIRRGTLPAALAPLVILALAVHLLAAGGIAIPGVAYSFWIVLGLGVNLTPGALAATDAAPAKTATPWGSMAAMALAGSLATACYVTAYSPVLRRGAAMYRVAEAQRRDPRRVEAALFDAAAADPLAYEPRQLLAALEYEELERHNRDKDDREQFDRDVQVMLRLRPQSSGAFRQAGRWALDLYRHTGDPNYARQAQEFYERAVGLYPQSAPVQADYALALHALGKAAEAQHEARRALELDGAMPHADKKLPGDVRRRLDELDAGPAAPAAGADSR